MLTLLFIFYCHLLHSPYIFFFLSLTTTLVSIYKFLLFIFYCYLLHSPYIFFFLSLTTTLVSIYKFIFHLHVTSSLFIVFSLLSFIKTLIPTSTFIFHLYLTSSPSIFFCLSFTKISTSTIYLQELQLPSSSCFFFKTTTLVLTLLFIFHCYLRSFLSFSNNILNPNLLP